MPTANNQNRIALVDDDIEERKMKRLELLSAGYDPYVLEGKYSDITKIVEQIQKNANCAFCDHSLQPKGMASFSGAEVVAELTKRKFPAILVTQFAGMDTPKNIRPQRRFIPVVIANEDTYSLSLSEAFEICKNEIKGIYRPDRVATRTIIRVERIEDPFIDVIVPSWNPKQAVRIMKSMLNDSLIKDACLIEKVKIDKHFFAKVNTSATDADDLYFYDFEDAVEPPEDFLA